MFLKGQALEQEIIDRESRMETVSLRKVDVLPAFETYIFGTTFLLGLAYLFQFLTSKNPGEPKKPFKWNPSIAIGLLSTLAYLGLLSIGLGSYIMLTTIYSFAIGLAITHAFKKLGGKSLFTPSASPRAYSICSLTF